MDHCVKHALHALILESRTTKHWLNFASDRASAQALNDFLFRELTIFKVLFHELFISLSSGFNHVFTPLFSIGLEFGRNFTVFELHTLASFIPDDGAHLQKVNNPFKGIFSTNRNNDRHRISLQTFTHLIINLEEVGTSAVHLVDKGQTRHMILVSLTPHGFRLWLHATDCAVNHASAVQNTHRAFHFNSEVNVPRSVNDV